MRLRDEVLHLVEHNLHAELNALVARRPRALRFLLGLSYSADAEVRRCANAALARGGRSHPNLVQNIVRRLVWAMNDESGTNALTAPAVVAAIAEEDPTLLLPMLPDLIRLCGDETLRPDLARALRLVSSGCPGRVGHALQDQLNKQLERGCHRDF